MSLQCVSRPDEEEIHPRGLHEVVLFVGSPGVKHRQSSSSLKLFGGNDAALRRSYSAHRTCQDSPMSVWFCTIKQGPQTPSCARSFAFVTHFSPTACIMVNAVKNLEEKETHLNS